MDSRFFAAPFQFSIGRIFLFDDALAEIACAPEILSWEAQCVDMSLDHVFYRWATMASEEAEV
jgi:hypothetical protein